jgi:tRNA(Arg) A34 adenosine deaminase TadA
MCLGAIYWARPDKIYYSNTKEDAAAIGFDDHFIYQEIDKAIAQRHLPTLRLVHPDALSAFRIWQEKGDKTLY